MPTVFASVVGRAGESSSKASLMDLATVKDKEGSRMASRRTGVRRRNFMAKCCCEGLTVGGAALSALEISQYRAKTVVDACNARETMQLYIKEVRIQENRYSMGKKCFD